MSALEEVMRSYADSLAGSTETEAAALMAEANYVAALCRHDWYFSRSDDHRAYKAGEMSWSYIAAAQPVLDPDYKLWNTYCHPDFRRELATVSPT